jgi:hypothetical protein
MANQGDEDPARVNEKYPLHKNLQEMIFDMRDWKESLK